MRIKIENGGIAWVIQIVFLVLKLTKVITWPWVWVLAPMWIELILSVVIIVLYLILNQVK